MALWMQFRKIKHSSNISLSTVYKFITFTIKKLHDVTFFQLILHCFAPKTDL